MNLLIYLLGYGEVDIQRTIFNYFSKNLDSENFFKIIHSKIHEEIHNLKRKKSPTQFMQNIKKFKYNYMHSEFNIISILQLLQLLCKEGSNSNLQNYLRE
jgi:hypothetical protein